MIKIKDLKLNEDNPRFITDGKMKDLVRSISDFPKMMKLRPIVVDKDNVILGGNMRYQALLELKFKEIPDDWVIRADDLTEDQKREFIIKDNVGFGEWDWDTLANEWGEENLIEWGLDIAKWQEEEEPLYTTKIDSPTYSPAMKEPPSIEEMIDREKYDQLIMGIEDMDFPEEQKEFFRLAATRHIVIDYGKVAEYYAHADADSQGVMELLALVVIDYDQAIADGYVELSKKLTELHTQDYAE